MADKVRGKIQYPNTHMDWKNDLCTGRKQASVSVSESSHTP
jgi:hypothetical protein